mmetsp:Transcript_61533/g.170626  ORF Transcript_61533/g.170626 Transcript_61533/m.170626 type:complete len:187 (+) Transcript_61533:88-648(+)
MWSNTPMPLLVCVLLLSHCSRAAVGSSIATLTQAATWKVMSRTGLPSGVVDVTGSLAAAMLDRYLQDTMPSLAEIDWDDEHMTQMFGNGSLSDVPAATWNQMAVPSAVALGVVSHHLMSKAVERLPVAPPDSIQKVAIGGVTALWASVAYSYSSGAWVHGGAWRGRAAEPWHCTPSRSLAIRGSAP